MGVGAVSGQFDSPHKRAIGGAQVNGHHPETARDLVDLTFDFLDHPDVEMLTVGAEILAEHFCHAPMPLDHRRRAAEAIWRGMLKRARS
jgi:hypothetical protein